MKLSRSQKPYWIDGPKTERAHCVELSKPVQLRNDEGRSNWMCGYVISVCLEISVKLMMLTV